MVRSFFGSLVAVVLIFLTACDDPAPIKIGFIGGLTGRFSVIGEAARNGVQLAVAEINKAGGINGREVELLVRDDASSPEVAVEAIRDLHSAGAVAIVGPNISSIAAAMLSTLNELRIPAVSPTTASLSLAGIDDYLFRINATTRDYARAYARYLFEGGQRTIAVTLDANNPVFTESWSQEFTSQFEELGGTIALKIFFDAGSATGYSDVADRLLATSPDGIVLVANSVDTAQLAQQIRKREEDIPLAASEWASSERMVFLGGNAVEGIVLAQSYIRNDPSERYQRFVGQYRERFQQDPSFASISGHDGATMLFAALAENVEGPELKQALLRLRDIQGLQQRLWFDEFGDGWRRVIFYTIKNGRFVQQ